MTASKGRPVEPQATASSSPGAWSAAHDSPQGSSSVEDAALVDPAEWLTRFQQAKGRPLRVLHVGNIANNAFLNAKLQRRAGVDAWVLAFDYYHALATPEWEEVDIRHGFGDEYLPRFSARDTLDWQRPRWFVQGPVAPCADYMDAVFDDRRIKAGALWRFLPIAIRLQRSAACAKLRARLAAVCYQLRVTRHRLLSLVAKLKWMGFRLLHAIKTTLFGTASRLKATIMAPAGRSQRPAGQPGSSTSESTSVASSVASPGPSADSTPDAAAPACASPAESRTELIRRFAEVFPQRSDRLTGEDMAPYAANLPLWQRICAHFDIVQGYGTEPVWLLLSGTRPYVAFEHGTLRDFTAGDSALHRLTSLAYRLADHTFITNGDCQPIAAQLGIRKCSPMIHPVDVDQHRHIDDGAVAALAREYAGELLLFCPLRHDWAVKGTHIHLQALPLIKRWFGEHVVLVVTNWGRDVQRSRELVRELDCEDNVRWVPPLCRIQLIHHLHAADVVLDQIALPHFGATAPQALAAGTPVVMSYQPSSTQWIVAHPAPILPAFNPEEVAEAVRTAMQPQWRDKFERDARSWVDNCHHHDRSVREHLQVYRKLIGEPQ
ncbi:MAG: glycosyltransferase [Gammaproteobacteria bacterium]|nr:glycosyltransferase [Gammaproteobacteria bacterium]